MKIKKVISAVGIIIIGATVLTTSITSFAQPKSSGMTSYSSSHHTNSGYKYHYPCYCYPSNKYHHHHHNYYYYPYYR